jgi:hypothetical protein
VNLSYHFKKRYALSLNSAFTDDDDDTRHSAIFSRSGDWKTGTNFRIGLVADHETVGWLVAGSRYLWPGIRAEISYQSLPPPAEDDEERDYLLTFGLTLDFAYAQGRFLPTYGTAASKTRGAIAGRIAIEDAHNLSRYDLSDIAIVVQGKRTARTDASGNFYMSNLETDMYVVELDVENLPIELVPERTSLIVGVAASATTRVDFVVRPEFGIAGRVTGSNGRRLEGIVVELFDSGGNFLKSTVTDQFGLYRIDGMSPGDYVIRVASESLPGSIITPQERKVTITNDFLFDQDVQFSIP